MIQSNTSNNELRMIMTMKMVTITVLFIHTYIYMCVCVLNETYMMKVKSFGVFKKKIHHIPPRFLQNHYALLYRKKLVFNNSESPFMLVRIKQSESCRANLTARRGE